MKVVKWVWYRLDADGQLWFFFVHGFGKVLAVEGAKATNEGGRQGRETTNTKLPSEVTELTKK